MTAGHTPGKLSREEIAKREIGQTDISPRLAWVMTILFLLTLAIPPTAQFAYDIGSSQHSGRPSSLELFRAFPAVAHAFQRTEGSLWNRVVVANRHMVRSIEEYEHQLEDRSLLTQHLLAPTQQSLTELAGLGNEKAYVGRDGWLFYRPDVDYLTGPGFLQPAVLHRRTLGGQQHLAPPQPDPRPAILEFHEQLARRGIRLILMPMPGKSAIHPEHLSSRFNGAQQSLDNASFQQLQRELTAAGVLVFDPAPILIDRKHDHSGESQFLLTDTHWTPAAMRLVADRLTEFIHRHGNLPTRTPLQFNERKQVVENLGDIAAMLHLPANQSLFARERAVIQQVIQPDGRDWAPDPAADVLLLGDSYTNIYSLAEMNWGAGAGLAERLSFTLRRNVDRLAQNDGGAHAVRQTLAQELARDHDRLRGKRIVIWEFAVRELAFGDWKNFPLPDHVPAADDSEPASPPQPSGELLVRGTVGAAAGAPQPGSVPYRDAVTGVHLTSVEPLAGPMPHREIVVYLWGLRDDRLTAAAKLAPDQTVTFKLTPWDAVRSKYERFNRIELDDPEFRLAELPTYWAEEVP